MRFNYKPPHKNPQLAKIHHYLTLYAQKGIGQDSKKEENPFSAKDLGNMLGSGQLEKVGFNKKQKDAAN